MALLKKPLVDPGQRAKANLLVSCSIWNQPNLEGKTAQNFLQEHPDWESLRSYFELNRSTLGFLAISFANSAIS